MKLFKKILIANRGEIAVRIIRSAKELNIKTVVVHSETDRCALFVLMADESYCIGIEELSETYLNIEKIINVAQQTGCDAIHPGYGFLAENPDFVQACEKTGIVFIGPCSKVMKLMGNKIAARKFIKKIGVPLVDATTGDKKTILEECKAIPFPLLVKAAAGGGGKGMKIVNNLKELKNAIESTSREAKSYFGDGTVYVEKYINSPRHIEFQIIGDNYGNLVHLFERECSIQRRYQKIIEESPSPTLTDQVRQRMGEAAVRIGKEIAYNNAGTIEFLVDKDLNFYFLEMNTRIQVEHPVTEMVTGIDIVREQMLIAAGNKLSLVQENIKQTGHSIECRIYAEDPENNFLPCPGKMTLYKEPAGKNIRIDSGINGEVSIHSSYDPMISKLIVWGEDRNSSRSKMITALNDYIIHGIKTNISYLNKLLEHDAFISNSVSTDFCAEYSQLLSEKINSEKNTQDIIVLILGLLVFDMSKNEQKNKKTNQKFSIWEEIGFWRDYMVLNVTAEEKDYSIQLKKANKQEYIFGISGKKYSVFPKQFSKGYFEYEINKNCYKVYISSDDKNNISLSYNGLIYTIKRKDVLLNEDVFSDSGSGGRDSNNIYSPMPGKVIKIAVMEGDSVNSGDLLLVVEAMKMENNIYAHKDAIIESLNISAGDMVDGSKSLILLRDKEDIK